jgi:hypothetical protein
MKRLFAIMILLSSATAFSQVSYYKGEWTKVNTQDNFAGFLRIEIRDTVVTGEIIWTYRSIDSTDETMVKYYKGQKGKMGIEIVEGVFSAASSDIHLQGTSKIDPDNIIGMDKYLLKLSYDKTTMYGRTLSNGENTGLVYFTKVNAAVAEKEFRAKKDKISRILNPI